MKERRSAAAVRSSPEARDLIISTSAVAALAIAQPILDLVGRSPQFFTARATPPADIALLAVGIAVVIPMLIAGLAWLVYRWRPTVGRVTHLALLGLLGALLALTVLQHTPARDAAAIWSLPLALCFGAALVLSYRLYAPVRSGFRIAALAPFAVVGAFLLVGPTSNLLWASGTTELPQAVHAQTPTPVVILVFDEFPIASLLDDRGTIQEEHFPNFAELAEQTTWFRNAVGVQSKTELAIPTILSGVRAEIGEIAPTAAFYPETLFTLLSGSFDVQAVETVTELCPAEVCENESRPPSNFGSRWRTLLADLAIVSGHVFLPSDLRSGLPPIDQTWGDFGMAGDTQPEDWSIKERFRERVDSDRRKDVTRFLDLLEGGLGENELYFFHALVPHWPWIHLPDGRPYGVPGSIPGTDGGGWGANAWLVEQAYQRHLLQVQYSDSILGQVVDSLKATDSFDDTMIVVVADHGVAIRPGIPNRRGITGDTVGDVAAVPLFIKVPGQTRGIVDDYRAETTDVLPTVSATLGIDVPWAMDGVDLFGATRPQRSESTMSSDGGPVVFGTDGTEKLQVAEYHFEYSEGRGPYGIVPLGYSSILGKSVNELSVGPESEERAVLNHQSSYRNFRRDVDVAPLLMTGIVGNDVGEDAVLGVSVNNVIVAVTRTWVGGDKVRFQALVPPDALDDGSNAIDLFIVEDAQAGAVRPLPIAD
jgi:Sulfatase